MSLAVAPSPVPSGGVRHEGLVLRRLIERLRTLLEDLNDTTYLARPAPLVSGSIGEHVRHCLDHFQALVAAQDGGVLNYDHRARGTSIEVDRLAALDAIDRLLDALDDLDDAPLDLTFLVTSLIDPHGHFVAGPSSLAREIAFVVQHTVHHYAIIALLLDRLGLPVPAYFGHAPSTPRRGPRQSHR